MSDESPVVPAPVKKSGMFQSLVWGVVAFLAIAFGISGVWRSVSSMMGWDDASAYNVLLAESNDASKEAVKQIEIGEPLFASVMEAVRAQPLIDVRLEQKDNGRRAIEAFQKAAEQFELTGMKLDEALALDVGISEEQKSALRARAKGCHLLGEVIRDNVEICEIIFDQRIASEDEVEAKARAIMTKRDAVQKDADAALAEWQSFVAQNDDK